jgi:hypothetical protein
MDATTRGADAYRPIAQELATNGHAIATLLAQHTANSDGMCSACGRPGTGFRHIAWPCPVAALALLAKDIRDGKLTAMLGNGAATGSEGQKRCPAHGAAPNYSSPTGYP